MKLTKQEKHLIKSATTMDPDESGTMLDPSEFYSVAMTLIRKLSLERKPKRVKVIKGWADLDPIGGWSFCKRQWKSGDPRATLTIHLPKSPKSQTQK